MIEAADLAISPSRLASQRHKRGWSQRELGRRARVSRDLVEAMELGDRINPTLRILGRLLAALDCELDDLVEA